MTDPAASRQTSSGALRVALIATMALGSVCMWLVAPIGWIWLASHLQKSSQPSLGPYVLVLLAIPTTMVVIGKLLGRLDRLYGEVTGVDHKVRVPLPWMKSMRGERGSQTPLTMLSIVMIVSVSVAGAAFGIWFFFFAGSSLPH